ncbi:inositol polyphosphate 5-phosphatase OCRL-like isoform X2 [Liolophura sinensis]|uniref:inositol polyphosphate 5-phosphatase OCRL-like isoform X2 n=1 Tax=Liolophura sinensis TaxID=3198878 RepID=UPI0031593C4A
MDPSALVKKKLSPEEKCLICLEVGFVQDWLKSTKYLALVERHRDHAIFVYSSSRVPCLDASDLSLDTVLPIERDLRCTAASDLGVSIKSSRGNLLLELPQGSQTDKFLSELQKSRDVLLKSNGLPSSFSWIDKYTKPGVKNSGNVFATDVFDPLKQGGSQSSASQSLNMNDLLGLHVGMDVPVDNTPNYMYPANAYLPLTTTQNLLSAQHSEKDKDILPIVDDHFTDPYLQSKLSPAVSKDSLDSWAPTNPDSVESSLHKQLGLPTPKPVTARETFVKHYMADRESEFVNTETIRVFCGTWNVNGQAPAENLVPWLSPDSQPPDIYAIGFQELDLSKEAFIFSESARELDWKRFVEEALHLKQKYKMVKLVRLVGIMLIVYVKKDLWKNVTLVDSESVPTGIMGIMGNKGGVAVRFTVHNTSFCFVNSHLAAHQDEWERRNQDYRDINSKMRFKTFVPPLTISEHDVIFWIGDLNYRLSDIDIDSVKSLISKKEYDKLFRHDQLFQQMGPNSDIFKGYNEHEITFRPSYKYTPGSDDWDGSEKNRAPAWCDRILWKGSGIKQKYYTSQPKLRVSDHKPVLSLFEVAVKVIDQVRYKKVYEDVMKKLDRLENEFLPQVKLDRTEFEFKNVKFFEPQVQVLTIANTGQLPVQFEFINKLDDDSYSKPWLTVDPVLSTIMPGYSCEVEIKVEVMKSAAGLLNSGAETIEDILVLHLDGGKDFFVPITGSYIPSTFGSSLEALIQMHEPIHEVPVAQLIDLEAPGSLEKRVCHDELDGPPFAVPKEIWRLVDHLNKHGIQQNDLFRLPGLHSEVKQIRDCLDTGIPDKVPGSVHSVAEALLIFLQCLPEPVIPYNVYRKCLDSCTNFFTAKQVLQDIPEHHKNVFKYLCAFLRELLRHSKENGLDEKFLASLFGEIFLRAPNSIHTVDSRNSSAKPDRDDPDERKRAAFVYLFLTNEYDD